MRESAVASHIRLKAAQLGLYLFRNNVGVLRNLQGTPVRYGLCNESAQQCKRVKSSDYVGITPVFITPDMVGTVVGVFTAVETKEEGWVFNPADDHEAAQAAFHKIVQEAGGFAGFAASVADFLRIVRRG